MEAPRVLPEKSEVHQEIVFTKEYILAMISALGHVMRVPQQNYSCHSRHSRTLCSFTGRSPSPQAAGVHVMITQYRLSFRSVRSTVDASYAVYRLHRLDYMREFSPAIRE